MACKQHDRGGVSIHGWKFNKYSSQWNYFVGHVCKRVRGRRN